MQNPSNSDQVAIGHLEIEVFTASTTLVLVITCVFPQSHKKLSLLKVFLSQYVAKCTSVYTVWRGSDTFMILTIHNSSSIYICENLAFFAGIVALRLSNVWLKLESVM